MHYQPNTARIHALDVTDVVVLESDIPDDSDALELVLTEVVDITKLAKHFIHGVREIVHILQEIPPQPRV